MKILLNGIFDDKTQSPLLKVKIADSYHDQQTGLMNVKSMNENHGMLFKFSREQKLNFWGHNTYLPLDIAFVDKNGIICKISYISPMSEKIVSSETPSLWAIEANHGYFSKNNISSGDKVFLHKTEEGNYLSFHKKRRKKHIKSENYNLRNILSQINNLSNNNEIGNDFNARNDDQLKNIGQDANTEELPVIDVSDINKILEDNIDDKANIEDNTNVEDTQKQYDDLEQRKPQDTEEGFSYPIFGNVFDAYKWAEANNEIMNIVYTTEKGRTINRQVEPHGHFYAKTTNRQIFVVFDRTVGDIRAFIMTNIGSFSFAKNRFVKKFRLI